MSASSLHQSLFRVAAGTDRVGAGGGGQPEGCRDALIAGSRRGRRTGGAARVLRPYFARTSRPRCVSASATAKAACRTFCATPAVRQPGLADRWHGAAGGDPTKVRNATLVYDDGGRRVARYDKIHLFGFSRARSDTRSQTIEPGSEVVCFDAPFGRVGLSVCYDLRFPELFRAMGRVDLIVLPAAFTYTTGGPTGRCCFAPAIENQCYVLGAGPGRRHPQRTTHLRRHHADRPVGRDRGTPPRGPRVVRRHRPSTYRAHQAKPSRAGASHAVLKPASHHCIENQHHEHRNRIPPGRRDHLLSRSISTPRRSTRSSTRYSPPARLRRHVFPVPPHEAWSLEEGHRQVGQFQHRPGHCRRARDFGRQNRLCLPDDISLPALSAAEATRRSVRRAATKIGEAAQPSARLYRGMTRSPRSRTPPRSSCWSGSRRWRARRPACQGSHGASSVVEVIMVARNDGHLRAMDVRPAGARIGDGHHGRQGRREQAAAGGGGRFDYLFPPTSGCRTLRARRCTRRA